MDRQSAPHPAAAPTQSVRLVLLLLVFLFFSIHFFPLTFHNFCPIKKWIPILWRFASDGVLFLTPPPLEQQAFLGLWSNLTGGSSPPWLKMTTHNCKLLSCIGSSPSAGGRPLKVHCRWRWRATSTPSGAGGAAKEGESRIARARAAGEGPGDC